MKKVFMTLAAVLMGMTAANAQLVIGGNIGVGGQVGQSDYKDGVLDSKQDDYFNLSIAPKIGYELMDGKLEVGAGISVGYQLQNNYGGKLTKSTSYYYFTGGPCLKANHKSAVKTGKSEYMSLNVTPYVRYFFLQKGIFSLGIQCQVALGGNFSFAPKQYAFKGEKQSFNLLTQEDVYTDFEITQAEADEINEEVKEFYDNIDYKYFGYGIYVMPVMKFDLTEHCYMDVTLNSIGLYAVGSVSTQNTTASMLSTEYTVKQKTTNFNGGFTGFSQGNAISVGFAYKF